MVTHDSCGALRCSARNHHVTQFPMGLYWAAEVVGPEAIMPTILEPMGWHTVEVAGPEATMPIIPKPMGRRIAEVAGAEAIVTMIPKLMEHHAYRMCGAFRFCTTTSPSSVN
jgi:hypothetical protein